MMTSRVRSERGPGVVLPEKKKEFPRARPRRIKAILNQGRTGDDVYAKGKLERPIFTSAKKRRTKGH